jgi:Xaa-Pro dipeptidase
MNKQLWFPREEYLARLDNVRESLHRQDLDILLAFQPESVTYLTGFFTRGYASFQFAVIPVEGEPLVVCRDVEEYYIDRTCAFDNRRLWSDSDDKNAVMIDAVKAVGGKSPRIGVEKSAWQLTAACYEALQAGLSNAELVGADDLVGRLRLIKSPAEIELQRKAARAAEAGMAAGAAHAKTGAREREMAAAITSAMILAGSDLPGPGVLSSGERAFHLHGGYTDRVLEKGDIVQLECTPCVRHYHARFMRAMKVGQASSEDHALARHLVEIQDRAISHVGPGVPAAVPDRIYRDGILSAGLEKKYTNKTFYSIGLLLHPSGGEPLEAAPGCTWKFQTGMTFHTYLLVRGFGFSETICITDDGCERLTHYPRELIVT